MATLNTDATVRGVQPGLLQVTSQEDGDWIVSIPRQAEKITFRGSATPKFLQPGMAVRFRATFRKTEKRIKELQATLPISSLEIISLTPSGLPGIFPDDAGGLLDDHEDDYQSEDDQVDAAAQAAPERAGVFLQRYEDCRAGQGPQEGTGPAQDSDEDELHRHVK